MGAERRQLTVLFCDLADSTALSQRLDPEDLREVLARYQSRVTEVVARSAGYVAKFMGDGILVYFGYPAADENDVERAIDTGLALAKAVAELDTLAGPLSARIGVASGVVVVGDLIGRGEAAERGVVGVAPNLAARLQGLAAPGEVVIDSATHEVAGKMFEVRHLDARILKGFKDPVSSFVVLRRRSSEARVETLQSSLRPMVAREEELDAILRRWRRVRIGDGQVIGVTAEPGFGKSRLLVAAAAAIGTEAARTIWLFCSQQHQESPMFPFIDLMGRLAGWETQDPLAVRVEKLRQIVPDHERAMLMVSMMGVQDDGGHLGTKPSARRQTAINVVLDFLGALGECSPVLIIIEDAHWIDPTSGEVLAHLVERVATRPLCLLVAYRPDYKPTWAGEAHVKTIRLTRLTKADTAELVRVVSGGDRLDAEVFAQIVERTEGVPLFVEELTRVAMDSNFRDGPSKPPIAGSFGAALPATLQASLMARLDRVAPAAREVILIGACIGREFPAQLLSEASGLSDRDFSDALSQLLSADLLRISGGPQSSYAFKHALIQDAAYGFLLRDQRRALHARIAELLNGSSERGADIRLETLAHHLFEGGQPIEASHLWRRAGEQALANAAHREGIVLLRRALSAMDRTEKTSVLLAATIDLRRQLHNALYPLGLLQEALTNLAQAELLAEQLDDRDRLAGVLSSQNFALAATGDLTKAAAAGERALSLLTESDQLESRAGVHLMLSRTLYAAGRYPDALAHARRSAERLGEDIHGGSAFGLNTTVASRVWLTLCLAELGDLDAAAIEGAKALDLSSKPECHIHERLWSRLGVGRLALIRGDIHDVVDLLRPMLELCQGEFAIYFSRVASTLGAALSRQGHHDTALPLLARADEMAADLGFNFGHALVLTLRSEAQLAAGQTPLALGTAERAIEAAQRWGERGNEARAYLALGDILNASNKAHEAQTHYWKALSIALQTRMAVVQTTCRRRLEVGSAADGMHRSDAEHPASTRA